MSGGRVLGGALVLALGLGLSGCSTVQNAAGSVSGIFNKTRMAFDGHRYRARLGADKEDRTRFTVTVSPVSQSLTGAREAARYEATRYCIRQFGDSTVTWTVGPDTAASAYRIEKDTLVFGGACKGL